MNYQNNPSNANDNLMQHNVNCIVFFIMLVQNVDTTDGQRWKKLHDPEASFHKPRKI